MDKGHHIVIEGMTNYCSELLERLTTELSRMGLQLEVVRRGVNGINGAAADMLEHLLQSPYYPVNERAEVLLRGALNVQALEHIQQAVGTGTTCLVEGGYLSLLVRQYYGHPNQFDYRRLNEILEFITTDHQADITVVLDTPVGELTPQIIAHYLAGSRANEDASYLERIRAGYLWEANQRNLPVIYAVSDIDTVYQQVWQQIAAALQLSNRATMPGMSSVANVLAAKIQPGISPLAAGDSPIIIPVEEADTTALVTVDKSGASQVSIIERASQLLVQKLGPQAKIAGDELRYEQKDTQGHYAYYIPDGLRGKLRSQYIRTMNQLFDTYGQLLNELTTYIRNNTSAPSHEGKADLKQRARQILRVLLPAAATSTIEVKKLLDLDESEPTSITQISVLGKLADELLPANHTQEALPVTLANYSPRNELDITPNILYSYSDLPAKQLQSEIAGLPYQRKLDVFQAYMHDPISSKNVLANIHYTFDIICDHATFQSLQPQIPKPNLTWQPIGPRLGYATPPIIEEAGLSDAFDDCFDASLQLYSALQAEGLSIEAQYATLLGHKLRCSLTCNASRLISLQHANIPTGLLSTLHEKVAEVHPMLAEIMNFTSYVQAAEPRTASPGLNFK